MRNKNLAEMKIVTPKYRCPKHGIIEHVLESTIKGIDDVWCLTCWVEWVDKHIPKVKEIKEKK